MSTLAELFPDADFRHHLTLRRGSPHEFFRNSDGSGRLLLERRRWIQSAPRRYADLTQQGVPLLAEFLDLCGDTWNILCGPVRKNFGSGEEQHSVAVSDLERLGGELEPDVLFLSPDENGGFRLHGGVLCFPTGWALEEKMGCSLDFIHGVVPGLNAALAAPIHQFLSKLKPGVTFQRDNWGLSASEELNQHPSRGLPPPHAPVTLNQLWLRVEHQALVALPESKGVAFGIRVVNHRLNTLEDRGTVKGLLRALQSMPAAMAEYKRIATVREQVVEALKVHYVL
jgi:dimethylamine monooxygenase subunit A